MATTIAGKDDIKLTVLGPDAAAKADGAATSTPPSPSRYAQWLRAAVLGASDGLVSTAALMLGISAARPADLHAVLSDPRRNPTRENKNQAQKSANQEEQDNLVKNDEQ
ncbi:hypothetical protein ACP70R_003968 [Stipagrostis hirtigluma subsp. patula]